MTDNNVATSAAASEGSPRVAVVVGSTRPIARDAIIVGSRRLHGMHRLSGRNIRDRILRLTSLPVLVAPTLLQNGIHKPLRFGSVSG
jgi:nucleotide-binding universal stress UspA family protein